MSFRDAVLCLGFMSWLHAAIYGLPERIGEILKSSRKTGRPENPMEESS